jgi:hypothetical protein
MRTMMGRGIILGDWEVHPEVRELPEGEISNDYTRKVKWESIVSQSTCISAGISSFRR